MKAVILDIETIDVADDRRQLLYRSEDGLINQYNHTQWGESFYLENEDPPYKFRFGFFIKDNDLQAVNSFIVDALYEQMHAQGLHSAKHYRRMITDLKMDLMARDYQCLKCGHHFAPFQKREPLGCPKCSRADWSQGGAQRG